jgi:hypothetical protein
VRSMRPETLSAGRLPGISPTSLPTERTTNATLRHLVGTRNKGPENAN